MKICIIGDGNTYHMPYLNYYENILQKLGLFYDVIYWDRYDTEIAIKQNYFRFSWCASDGESLFKTISGYVMYRLFILNHLKKYKYDILIILTSQVGCCILDKLKRYKYILDIRDYTRISSNPFAYIERKLIKKAALVVISSRGFEEWLPSCKSYVMCPNISFNTNIDFKSSFNYDRVIATYIGTLGYFPYNIEWVKAVQTLPIMTRYIGKSNFFTRKMKQFCLDNQVDSVQLDDRGYSDSKTRDSYYEDTNFILNLYGNDTISVRTAISNKLYGSCVFKRPIIVNSGTYLARIVEYNGLGIVIDTYKTDAIYSKLKWYYEPDNYKAYVSNCDRYLKQVEAEYQEFEDNIVKIIAL